MKQYQYRDRELPALLKSSTKTTEFKIINDMVEMQLDGEHVVLPTAEAFNRLFKKVALLEQRLYVTENKASRAIRSNR